MGDCGSDRRPLVSNCCHHPAVCHVWCEHSRKLAATGSVPASDDILAQMSRCTVMGPHLLPSQPLINLRGNEAMVAAAGKEIGTNNPECKPHIWDTSYNRADKSSTYLT